MIARILSEGWPAALVNHLWQSTVVVGAAWLLAVALRKNAARVRYWVWMTASVKFLVPFSLLMMAGARIRSWVPVPVTQPAVTTFMAQATVPFTIMGFSGTEDTAPAVHRAAPQAGHHANLGLVLLIVWLSGALIVMARFARGWMRVRAAKRAARPADIAAEVPVLVSASSMEPGIVGILRPALLLPEGIIERLDAEQMRGILAHEMCHVRYRDNLTFAMHMVVETLYWFFPPVWWIGARLIEQREQACDEAVVEAGGAARAYAEGILNVCKFYVESPLACVAGVTGADLKKRIVRIMTERNLLRLDWRKKLILAAAALVVAALPVTLGLGQAAQTAALTADVTGIWQGTLHIAQANRDLRTEIKITKNADGSYKLVIYNIDQGGQPAPASKTTFENGTLSVAIDRINGKYEGKMSDDGKTITGDWTQGDSIPLVLTRVTEDAAWPIPEPPKPMAADAIPKFDVVTVKPSDPNRPGELFTIRGRHLMTINTPVNDLIKFAYSIQAKQLANAPAWFDDKFDIDGVPDVEGQPDTEQMRILVRNALEERFGLKFHNEPRELPVYALTVANGGPKMTITSDKPSTPGNFMFGGPGKLRVTNATMKDFCHGMQETVMDKPVVDQTGLTERYDFNLNWTPDASQFPSRSANAPPPPDDPNAPPSLYTAMQEQLGLKLESTKGNVDVMVIDHVEKPSAN